MAILFAGNKTYTYTYDNNGNILSISDGTNTTTYVYDGANQLIRENNQAGDFTHVWIYIWRHGRQLATMANREQ